MTDGTLTSMTALRAECETIAKAGYSLDHEEFIAGLIALAVPVRDANGEVRAALAVHAPQSRLTQSQLVGKLAALHAAANRMRSLI